MCGLTCSKTLSLNSLKMINSRNKVSGEYMKKTFLIILKSRKLLMEIFVVEINVENRFYQIH